MNVKQEKAYFIIILSVNNKKYNYYKQYVQASHNKMPPKKILFNLNLIKKIIKIVIF